MPALDLESVAVGRDRVVLRLAGEVDVYTAPRLRERVIELVGGGPRHVLVDLREVTNLDRTGMGVLVGGLKQVRAREGSLTVVTGGERILGGLPEDQAGPGVRARPVSSGGGHGRPGLAGRRDGCG